VKEVLQRIPDTGFDDKVPTGGSCLVVCNCILYASTWCKLIGLLNAFSKLADYWISEFFQDVFTVLMALR